MGNVYYQAQLDVEEFAMGLFRGLLWFLPFPLFCRSTYRFLGK